MSHTTSAIDARDGEPGAPGSGVRLRAYRPADLAAVRRICADTRFLGRPIDPVFEDRELFADYLTGFCTRCEPDALLIVESQRDRRTDDRYAGGCRFRSAPDRRGPGVAPDR